MIDISNFTETQKQELAISIAVQKAVADKRIGLTFGEKFKLYFDPELNDIPEDAVFDNILEGLNERF